MEDKILKMNLLGGMNEFVMNLGDEFAWEEWINLVPDELTEEDMEFIVEHEDLWKETCVLFGEIVKEYYEKEV